MSKRSPSLQNYKFAVTGSAELSVQTLQAVGNYFRILSSSSSINVRLGGTSSKLDGVIANQGVNLGDDQFLGIEITSAVPGVAVSGVIQVGSDGYFDNNQYNSGSVAVRPEDGTYWKTTGVTTLQVLPIVAPASNPNGLIVLSSDIFEYNSLNPGTFANVTLLAKSTTPANNFDGDIVLMAKLQAFAAGSWNSANGSLSITQKISAGQGLYLAWGVNTSILNASVKYKQL